MKTDQQLAELDRKTLYAKLEGLWDKRKDSTSFGGFPAWDMGCLPKSKGGLKIINLERQNKSLLLKQLHIFSARTTLHG